MFLNLIRKYYFRRKNKILCTFDKGLADAFIVIIGYLLTIILSTLLIRTICSHGKSENQNKNNKSGIDTGFVIGTCENILIITFILLEAYTALALIFAAKSIVRSKAMEDKPDYFIIGTMVNLTFSVIMAIIIKFAFTIL